MNTESETAFVLIWGIKSLDTVISSEYLCYICSSESDSVEH